MPVYRRSTTLRATPDELFDFLSKVDNLPTYFSGVKDAHHTRGDEVHVVAPAEVTGGHGDVNGEVHAEAWFTIDADRRALAWGSENANHYQGELQVTPVEEGSEVAVTLTTEHDDAESITQGIDETLAAIGRIVAQEPDLQE